MHATYVAHANSQISIGRDLDIKTELVYLVLVHSIAKYNANSVVCKLMRVAEVQVFNV